VGVCLVDDPHTLKVLEYGAAGLNTVHLAGRAESRYGGLVEYCTTEPAAIAEAIKRAEKADCGRALQKYVKRFDWAAVTESYLQAITTIK
jgi:glycosyltransferase involved in cell wall biosynthesis